MKYISKYLWSTLKTKWIIISAFFIILILILVISTLIKSGGVEGPVKKTVSTAETESEILFWTCSMDPQIKQDGPGRCPICGICLVPMREEAGGSEGVVFDSKIKEKYMCPMHPDVVSGKQDNCSECGMKLGPIEGKMEVNVSGLIQPQYECPIQCEGPVSDVPGYCSKCWRKLIKKEDQEELGPIGEKMGENVPGLIQPQYECPLQCEGPVSNVPGHCSKCWRKLKKKDDID